MTRHTCLDARITWVMLTFVSQTGLLLYYCDCSVIVIMCRSKSFRRACRKSAPGCWFRQPHYDGDMITLVLCISYSYSDAEISGGSSGQCSGFNVALVAGYQP